MNNIHNPENIDEATIPESWRFATVEEYNNGLPTLEHRIWEENKKQWCEQPDKPGAKCWGNWTIIVPINAVPAKTQFELANIAYTEWLQSHNFKSTIQMKMAFGAGIQYARSLQID